MANPTTNYGFVLPTPTDLVTDLPADFDVALQGVDTRLKALQPGTTLGDLAYSSATANTNTRLGVGTTGQVLTVAAGVPSWATPVSATTFSGALAFKTGDQTISNTTSTILSFGSETNGYDTNSYHDNTTNNSRMTIPSGKSGYFWVWCNVTWAPNATGRRIVRFLKNGTISFIMEATPNATAGLEPTLIGGKAFAAVATDYFELEVYQSSGGNLDVYGGSVYNTQFGVYYLGA
jgi:hypothetical protein